MKVRTLIMSMAAALTLASCGTKKAVVAEPQPKTPVEIEKEGFIQQVNENLYYAKYLTSKVKFHIEMGNQEMTLTGNLKMKRDDVIRLQLMAFGFVEAARLEFTPDYVLIQDRINKQYIKAAYADLAFMRNTGITFYTLQSLFWNELFKPGKRTLDEADLAGFASEKSDDDVILTYSQGRLDYKWLADGATKKLDMCNIIYRGAQGNNMQLNWGYSDFRTIGKQSFPGQHALKFTTPEREVKLDMKLNYIGSDSEWETRTEVKSQYKQVSIDDMLRRFMAL